MISEKTGKISKTRWLQKRFANRAQLSLVATVLPALVFLVLLWRDGPLLYPQWWFGGVAALFGIYFYLRMTRERPLHRGLTVFTAGLAVAGAVLLIGSLWMKVLYVPYVAIAGILGPVELAAACVAAAVLLGMDYYDLHPIVTFAEQATLLGTAILTGAFTGWAVRHAERRGKKSAELAVAPRDPTPVNGLMDIEDVELRDILEAVALALEPTCVVLFLHEEGELSFRASTMRDIEPTPQGLAYDVLRYRHSVESADLESVHYGPGYEREGVMASAAASPVLDGTYIAGVLVVDSDRTDAFSKEDVAVLEVFARQIARILSERRVLGEAEKNIQWLSLLREETAVLTDSLKTSAIVRRAADAMQKIVPSDVYVFLRQRAEWGFTLAYCSRELTPAQRSNLSMDGTLTGTAIDEKMLKFFADISNFPMPLMPVAAPDAKSALMVPLLYHGKPKGVVVMVSDNPDSFGSRHAAFIGLLGNQVAAALNNAQLHADIRRRALTDGLTGLINHRHFMERLQAEFKRFDRSGNPLSLMLVDADHFKRVNDTHGHPAGDQVLRDLAALIQKALRAQDVAARYGGEEFAAALPDTPPENARQIAERLRRSVEAFRFMYQDIHIPVTISVGLATCPLDDITMPGLIKKADEALYQAKQAGRNQVKGWSGP